MLSQGAGIIHQFLFSIEPGTLERSNGRIYLNQRFHVQYTHRQRVMASLSAATASPPRYSPNTGETSRRRGQYGSWAGTGGCRWDRTSSDSGSRSWRLLSSRAMTAWTAFHDKLTFMITGDICTLPLLVAPTSMESPCAMTDFTPQAAHDVPVARQLIAPAHTTDSRHTCDRSRTLSSLPTDASRVRSAGVSWRSSLRGTATIRGGGRPVINCPPR